MAETCGADGRSTGIPANGGNKQIAQRAATGDDEQQKDDVNEQPKESTHAITLSEIDTEKEINESAGYPHSQDSCPTAGGGEGVAVAVSPLRPKVMATAEKISDQDTEKEIHESSGNPQPHYSCLEAGWGRGVAVAVSPLFPNAMTPPEKL